MDLINNLTIGGSSKQRIVELACTRNLSALLNIIFKISQLLNFKNLMEIRSY